MLMMKKEDNSIDEKIVDNIRGLALDMINEANSGHPGIVLGAAPIISAIYANHLKFDTENDKWLNRDRFIMSAGHGSALLYATLYMAGFNISLEDLKKFRQLDSITPGHPEYGVTPGVDITTGPLGQGIASAVGVAIGEKYLNAHFGKDIIDYNTYVLCGDGDLMEGISYEAASLAGKLGLNKLIVLYDSNDISLDGPLDLSFKEDIRMRFESQNWDYILVNDGENTGSISAAISKAKTNSRPTLIEVKTIIGKHSKNQGTSKVHGSPLDKDDLLAIKEKLELWEIPFTVSSDAVTLFQETINERNRPLIEQWHNEVELMNDKSKKELNLLIDSKKPLKLKDIYYEMPEDGMDSTRLASGQLITSIANCYPFFIGGSADLTSSTYAKIKDGTEFKKDNPQGKNIYFGVREHAMGAIANGIASTGITPFASTFFTFSDYLKPAIRMSALMDLPVIYVFSHDSISVGEDGPTHQPIEQIIALRSMPNLDVYRPADANEVIGAYNTILENRKPAALLLGRNKVKIQELTSSSDVKMGAYIVTDDMKKINATLISTGEELDIAMEVHRTLLEKGIIIQVVSMPCMEIFERQDKAYKKTILPENKPIFVLEASSSYSWHKYVKDESHLFTIDEFGSSAPREKVLKKFGFTVDTIAKKIEEILK